MSAIKDILDRTIIFDMILTTIIMVVILCLINACAASHPMVDIPPARGIDLPATRRDVIEAICYARHREHESMLDAAKNATEEADFLISQRP